MIRCARCGTEAPPGARFCPACGAALPEAPPAVEARKTVTVLFCDVVGSTALAERRDPEAMRAVMRRYFDVARDVIEVHGGTVEKFVGDAVMAVFGVPTVHEDDALRAVRAADAIRDRLRRLNVELAAAYATELSCRLGVNTGEVVVGEGRLGTLATGDAVNVGARLQQAAAPGEILLGAQTAQLVHRAVTLQPAGTLTVKGKADPLPAWRLVSGAAPPAATGTAWPESPLVGRTRELGMLLQAYERSVADRSRSLVTLLGAPGVGKSRLLAEFRRRLPAEARVLTGRCLSYGEGIAFWPLLEILRAAAGLRSEESEAAGRARIADLLAGRPQTGLLVERLAPLAGLGGSPAAAEESQWALRRLVERLGQDGPVVLVIDDLHWAQPALLEVLDHLVDWVEDTALLVVVAARPEFLEEHPTWGGGKLNATAALLESLTVEESGRLLDHLLPDAALSPALRARVVATAGGVPLFVEQLLALLREADTGVGEAESAASVLVPPTISALFAARLDRLSPSERELVDAAAVVGQIFYVAALQELLGIPESDLRRTLAVLVRKALVRRTRSDLAGEDGFAFAHVLLRDAAYAGLPKLRRSDLHERFARWLGRNHAGSEAAQLVAHHLERAVALAREVAPVAPREDLVAEAVLRLQDAAADLAPSDRASAGLLLERAAELLPQQDPRRPELELCAGTCAQDESDFDRARRLLTRVIERSGGDDRVHGLAALALQDVQEHFGHEPTDEEWALADVLRNRCAAAGDPLGTVLATRAKLAQLTTLARWDEVSLLVDRLEEERRRLAPWMRDLVGSPRPWTGALIWGSTPVRAGLALLARRAGETSELRQQSAICHTRAVLLAMDGQPRAALDALAEGRRLLRELRLSPVQSGIVGGYALWIAGQPAEAEVSVRSVVRALQAGGETSWLSTFGLLLGEFRYAAGDLDEARHWAEVGRQAASRRDVISQAMWRALMGKVEARTGRQEHGLSLLDGAVDWVLRSQQINDHGEVHVSRAEVRALVGDHAGWHADLRAAIGHFGRKGNVARRRTVEELLAGSAGARSDRTG